MTKYLVISKLMHDKEYQPGEEVELGEGDAAILLRMGAIGEIPPPAPAKKVAKAD